jgi:hypothetical protein
LLRKICCRKKGVVFAPPARARVFEFLLPISFTIFK